MIKLWYNKYTDTVSSIKQSEDDVLLNSWKSIIYAYILSDKVAEIMLKVAVISIIAVLLGIAVYHLINS